MEQKTAQYVMVATRLEGLKFSPIRDLSAHVNEKLGKGYEPVDKHTL